MKPIAKPAKRIDPHALVALVRREMGLKPIQTGPEFPKPFGERPTVTGLLPDLDDPTDE
jgi:hypothetical protein